MRPKRYKVISCLLLFFIIFSVGIVGISGLASLPLYKTVTVGEKITVPISLPEKLKKGIEVFVRSDGDSFLLKLQDQKINQGTFSLDNAPVALHPGKFDIQLRLFGIIPLQNIKVSIVSPQKVLPGGHSIGVLLGTRGVIVVGHSAVISPDGSENYPAREAGILIGDVIRSINGKEITSNEEIENLINKAGEKKDYAVLKVIRGSEILKVKIRPLYCSETGRYRIGLYIRDSAAGLGTLTFYDPESGIYGALGHLLTGVDTDYKVEPGKGRIIQAPVQGIQQGKKGDPGEKIGMFFDGRGFSGNIEKNTQYGIFGVLDKPAPRGYYKELIPVASEEEVKTGPAYILTVVNGNKIEKFDIEIKKVYPQSFHKTKGLVLEITDPRLLNIAGGIVQGMSGSPIIQNGRLVGAITHVFINDPVRGYGVLAEQMLIEAGGLEKNIQKAS